MKDYLEDPLIEFLDCSIAELHSPDPKCSLGTAPIEEVIATMQEHRFGSLLIVDENLSLLGIVTERDILMKACGSSADYSRPVSEIMTRNPTTIKANESVAVALEEMIDGKFRHLPIVNMDGTPIGILSIRDIMYFLCEQLRNEDAA
jgi:CBS domain-containing protein